MAAPVGKGGDPAQALERLPYAATHRHDFMWPWETPPHSIAHGILDDETYDWLELLRGVLTTGGQVLVVGEPHLAAAFKFVHELTPIRVCHTGASGLAGLLAAPPSPTPHPALVTALLLTGNAR